MSVWVSGARSIWFVGVDPNHYRSAFSRFVISGEFSISDIHHCLVMSFTGICTKLMHCLLLMRRLTMTNQGLAGLITVTMVPCQKGSAQECRGIHEIPFGSTCRQTPVSAPISANSKGHSYWSKSHLWPMLHVVGGRLRHRRGSLLVLLPPHRVYDAAGDAGFAGDVGLMAHPPKNNVMPKNHPKTPNICCGIQPIR